MQVKRHVRHSSHLGMIQVLLCTGTVVQPFLWKKYTLSGTNVSRLGKRKTLLQKCLDKGYVSALVRDTLGKKKTPLATPTVTLQTPDIKQEAIILNHTQVMRLDPNKSSEKWRTYMDHEHLIALIELYVFKMMYPSLPNTFWVGVWTSKQLLRRLLEGPNSHLLKRNLEAFGRLGIYRDS